MPREPYDPMRVCKSAIHTDPVRPREREEKGRRRREENMNKIAARQNARHLSSNARMECIAS